MTTMATWVSNKARKLDPERKTEEPYFPPRVDNKLSPSMAVKRGQGSLYSRESKENKRWAID